MTSLYGSLDSAEDPEVWRKCDDEEVANQSGTKSISSSSSSSSVSSSSFSHRSIGSLLIASIFAIGGIGMFMVANVSKKNNDLISMFPELAGSSDVLTILTSNSYGKTNTGTGMFNYPFLLNSILLEPFRDTSVQITNPTEGCQFSWKLTGISVTGHDIAGVSTSTVFTVQPTKTGNYQFQIDEICTYEGSTAVSRSYTKETWVKYIRRELSSLNDDDREEFLDAFHTLWTTNTVDGKVKYGDEFKSLYYFAALHNDAGANAQCDEFHGGSGFVNNHVLLGAYLEQSLQLVNPRVALHYMEYTKYFEASAYKDHLSNQLDGGKWTDLLSDKWFGSSDPYSGRIVDSRWASTAVPTLNDAFFEDHWVNKEATFFPEEQTPWLKKTSAHISSPYGLLRAPWNYNPANYTVRYGNVFRLPDITGIDASAISYYTGVNCDSYKRFLSSHVNHQSIGNYLKYAEEDVHGIIHFTFGGIGGEYAASVNQQMKEFYGVSDECIGESALSTQQFFKSKWWAGMKSGVNEYIQCSAAPWQDGVLTSSAAPGASNTNTDTTPGDSSGSSSDGSSSTGGGPSCTCSESNFDSELSLDRLIGEFFKEKEKSMCVSVLDSLSTFEDRKALMKMFCSRMAFDGDMAGSSAAVDPLFWVAHGAVERLFQSTVFANTMTDTIYPDSEDDERCSGHSAQSTKAWLQGMKLMDDSTAPEMLTNMQLMDVLNPTTNAHRDLINYVYESNEFAWCNGFENYFT